MRIGLITPTDISTAGNPGAHLLTAGIRYLARAACPDAGFTNIAMLGDSAADWRAAAACDAVIVCGNPRFSMSTGLEFWEHAIWDRLLELQRAGVRIVDGWAGSAFPYSDLLPTVDEMAAAIAAFPRRREYLAKAAELPHHITRDATMQRIYEAAGIRSTLLPCSAWWAADELHVEPYGSRAMDVILLHAMPGHDWLPAVIVATAERMRDELPVVFLATTLSAYEWWRSTGADRPSGGNAMLVNDPASLLRIFARTRRLLSFRVHGAIPAARLGVETAVVAIDSRAQTCGAFGLPVIRFTELPAWSPIFSAGIAPDTEQAVRVLGEMLCSPNRN